MIVAFPTSSPPGVVTVMVTGTVPVPRVSTAIRTVVFWCAGTFTSRSAPSGNSSRSLSSWMCTVMSAAPLFLKPIGICALLEVMVIVL